ncbi:Fic family protein [Bdellovibrionota bacterium FG-2]
MTRDDLHPTLKRKYTADLPCGVEKVDDPTYKNMWFVVPPPVPKTRPKGLPTQALAKANRLIEQLPTAALATTMDKLVSSLYVRREAVESSRMERTFSTIDHILTPAEVYDQNESKSGRASVLGYATALEHEFLPALKKGATIFTADLVCRLHKAVMSKDPDYKGRPGNLREPNKPGSVVWIGPLGRPEDSIYNPTPAKHVHRCLKDFMNWMSDLETIELGDAGMGLPLAVRMALGHSHFEAIHPFPDGNGRVGRMLLALQMACSGKLPIYLSGYIEAEKREYVRALQQAQKKLNYGPIVDAHRRCTFCIKPRSRTNQELD